MSVHINLSSTTCDSSTQKEPKIHYMPCAIKSDNPANVSKYFEPQIKKQEDNLYSASFRGYPLHGQYIELPSNMKGYVIQEKTEKMTEEADKNVHVSHVFNKFMYWNWDQLPSKNDKIISALEWCCIAEALHSSD